MATAIEVRDVRQSFRTGFWLKQVEVLRGITFDVPEGTVFGLIGPNAAGKTTLIYNLAGVRRPTAGTVRVAGMPAGGVSARRKIGFLPERPYFHEHLTAEEFLRYMGTLAGMGDVLIRERMPQVLAAVDLSHARRTELRRFSKGMLQRVGLAQALIHDPGILILDEPMSGLDPIGRREMREMILRLAGDGKTVFLSSHIISDVEMICGGVAILDKGRVVRTGSMAELLKGAALATEIAVGALSGESLERLSREFGPSRITPTGAQFTVPPGATSGILARLLEVGAEIQAVRPVRASLEDIIFERGAQ